MASRIYVLLRMIADVAVVDPAGVLEVEVLGKHDDRQPDPGRPLTDAGHRAQRRWIASAVPRPLAADVSTGGERRHRSIRISTRLGSEGSMNSMPSTANPLRS